MAIEKQFVAVLLLLLCRCSPNGQVGVQGSDLGPADKNVHASVKAMGEQVSVNDQAKPGGDEGQSSVHTQPVGDEDQSTRDEHWLKGQENSAPNTILKRSVDSLAEVLDHVEMSRVKVLERLESVMEQVASSRDKVMKSLDDVVSESKSKVVKSFDSVMDKVSESKVKVMESFDSMVDKVMDSRSKVMEGLDNVYDKVVHSKVMEELDHVIDSVAHSKVIKDIRALPGELRQSFLLSVRNRSYAAAGIMVAVSSLVLVLGVVYYSWCHQDSWIHSVSPMDDSQSGDFTLQARHKTGNDNDLSQSHKTRTEAHPSLSQQKDLAREKDGGSRISHPHGGSSYGENVGEGVKRRQISLLKDVQQKPTQHYQGLSTDISVKESRGEGSKQSNGHTLGACRPSAQKVDSTECGASNKQCIKSMEVRASDGSSYSCEGKHSTIALKEKQVLTLDPCVPCEASSASSEVSAQEGLALGDHGQPDGEDGMVRVRASSHIEGMEQNGVSGSNLIPAVAGEEVKVTSPSLYEENVRKRKPHANREQSPLQCSLSKQKGIEK